MMDIKICTDLERLKQQALPDRTGVLVVDMQNDFCAEEGLYAKSGGDLSHIRSMIPNLGGLLGDAREQDIPIIYIQHTNSAATSSDAWLSREVYLERGRQDMCQKGSVGAEIIQEVAPRTGDLMIEKHRYSGFMGTPLELMLKSKRIKSVVVTGISTNVCVESTVRDAFMRDYQVIVPLDCVVSSIPELHKPSLVSMSHYFALVATSDAIKSCWNSLAGK